MRQIVPTSSIAFSTQDIYGQSIRLDAFYGRRVLLSFLDDINSPPAYARLKQLKAYHQQWNSIGLALIVIFHSPASTLKRHLSLQPDTIHIIADPNLTLYQQYYKTYAPHMTQGQINLKTTSNKPHRPADFLIEVDGTMSSYWCGQHHTDYMPLEYIHRFANRLIDGLTIKERHELQHLRKENKALKIELQSLKELGGEVGID